MTPGFTSLPAVQAELLYRLGRFEEAAAAYREALYLPGNGAQRRHLRQLLARTDHPTGG